MLTTNLTSRILNALRGANRKRAHAAIQQQRRSLLLESLEKREVFASGDLLISEFLANPTGNDTNQEYVELIATKAINFSATPYSVVWTNNGTATTNGWIAGGNITYGFNITSGSVSAGDVVYVGGTGMAPTGTKVRTLDVTTTAGDGFGNLQATAGVLGNGGANADAIGVFDVAVTSITSSTVPIDAIFFGTGMGTAVVTGGTDGYELPVNDNYAGGKAQSTSFLAPDAGSAQVVIATGTYNTSSSNFSTIRTWAIAPATATSEIALTGSAGAEVNVVGNGVNIADGDTTPSLADYTKFAATVIGGNSTRTFAIQNTGTSPLSLGTFSSSNPVFTIPGPLPSSVAAGGSINFNVVFTPTSTSLATSTISIVNGDSNENPYDFVVSGLGATATTAAVAINELRMRDSVNDNVSNNFVEIYQTAGLGNRSLSGLTLVALSSEFSPGLINFAVNLGSAVTDANGFVLIADDGTTASVDPGDVIRSDFDLFDTPATFLIVSGFTGLEGQDLDTDDVSGLDVTPWTSIIDSVSLDRSTLASQNYSPTVIASPDADAPAGVRRVPNGSGSYEILSFTSNVLDTPGSSNVVAGVLLTQSGGTTVVLEGGPTDTFDVQLFSEPTANVTVTLTINDGQTTTNVGSLTFTPSAGATPWNVPQTVTVTAVNDLINEGLHSGTINITTTSTQAAYNNLVVSPVSVSIIDNDGVPLSLLVLNEMHINPPGTDTGSEYIEFRGTPGALIPSDYYFVVLEGDSGTLGTEGGLIDHVFSLGGMAIGSNGFLVLQQAGSINVTNPNATVIAASGTGWGTTFSSRTNDIENGSNSYLLVRSATAPTPGNDVDAAEDGVLTGDALSWTIVDSIGIIDDDNALDTAYGKINFSAIGGGIVAPANTKFDLTLFDTAVMDGFTPDLLLRNGNTTGQTQPDWVAADTLGTGPNFTLDPAEIAPSGLTGSLNHIGSTNVFGGADITPPTVSSVFASGSAWSPAFIDAVDGGGTGGGNGLGYLLTSGLIIPNSGVNRLYVQFSEPVVGFSAANVALLGVNVANYSANLTVTYDSANMRGLIAISTPVTRDKLRIGVSAAVTDTALNALDGDNNGSAGGAFNFRYNILVGDASGDGSVNGGDVPPFATSFNQSGGSATYNNRADWNSDASVNGGDVPLFAGNFNQSLPGADPGSLPFFTAALSESSSLAPLVDSAFSQLDDEDDLLLF